MIKRNYLLGEPFLFMERYWVLQNLDIGNHTIELIRFPISIKPKGYKQGYYVDFDSLFIEHTLPVEVANRSDSSLFVLYFWGSWCQPCIKNMPKTNKIGQLAREMDKLNMYGVAYMRRDETTPDLRRFEDEHGLSFHSYTEKYKGDKKPMFHQL